MSDGDGEGEWYSHDEDCTHDTFERFGDCNGVYECADCNGRIIIPEFEWVKQKRAEVDLDD